ncbi:hypothetical protein NTE_03519 [Candidatus Nitrososphaera evergladensis SR1]|uniref:Uncharacterized protein n=1 Tax=Candidatus Nitrososphaera evergladensis SR1 TaxID=1459636 RepID=A0A075MY17_9ARCH|nr:hypothetical protein NTE_03519 [Candidatus Nitrososphaera evergladensis SR1]
MREQEKERESIVIIINEIVREGRWCSEAAPPFLLCQLELELIQWKWVT